MAKLLDALSGAQDRSARFQDGHRLTTDGGTLTFEGICEGHIATQRSGAKGFGYDPVFVPEGGSASRSPK